MECRKYKLITLSIFMIITTTSCRNNEENTNENQIKFNMDTINEDIQTEVTDNIFPVDPIILENRIEPVIQKIGSFTTPLINRTKNRVTNIKIASDKIDKHIILPGQEFSFNGVVGKATKDKGYKAAPIFISTREGTKSVYDTGGGICQLSSTLYNAAKKAGLKITERNSHTKKVPYIEKGADATIAYGSADLKFINSIIHPVELRVYLKDKELTVKVYSIEGYEEYIG